MDLLDDLFVEEATRLILDEKQEKILNKYIDLFEHGVPYAYIPKNVPFEKIYEEMDKCVKNKTDNLLERLDIEVKPNRLY